MEQTTITNRMNKAWTKYIHKCDWKALDRGALLKAKTCTKKRPRDRKDVKSAHTQSKTEREEERGIKMKWKATKVATHMNERNGEINENDDEERSHDWIDGDSLTHSETTENSNSNEKKFNLISFHNFPLSLSLFLSSQLKL